MLPRESWRVVVGVGPGSAKVRGSWASIIFTTAWETRRVPLVLISRTRS